MKKILLIAVAAVMTSCTQKMKTREWGGSSEIRLEKGQRLLEITWKNSNLWLLTEPMDSDYVPKTKTFYEDSSFGLYEGTITVIESR